MALPKKIIIIFFNPHPLQNIKHTFDMFSFALQGQRSLYYILTIEGEKQNNGELIVACRMNAVHLYFFHLFRK